MNLRRANQTDSVDIWEWRNDPRTREMFRKQKKVSWEAHKTWFSGALKDPHTVLYVGANKEASDKVGVVRFDLSSSNQTAEISINLNPRMRGIGLGTLLLNLAIEDFFKYFPLDLVAEVKCENIQSIQLFTKTRFQEISMTNNLKKFAKPFRSTPRIRPDTNSRG